ncbi:MAG: prepilin-type N-terminal cleavage/methylation domain-containing protein [Bdellovibrionota bacterium]
MLHPTRSRQRGFTLIEVLISVAVGLIVMFALGRVLLKLAGEGKRLEQKIEQIEIKNIAMTSFLNPDVCGCHLNPSLNFPTDSDAGLVFDSLSPGSADLAIQALRNGCPSAPAASTAYIQANTARPSGLKIGAISVKDLNSTSIGKEWLGTVRIGTQSKVGDTFKDVRFRLRFIVDDTAPSAAFASRCLPADLVRRMRP